jgi:site-specific DNA recombinase
MPKPVHQPGGRVHRKGHIEMAAAKRRKAERACGIVRISKDRPDETSTTTQTDQIGGYCNLQGLDLVRVFEEKGTAYRESRKLQAPKDALALVKAGAVDVVVCWKIDRVARNARDLLNLIHEIEQAGGAFVSVQEAQFDTRTPMGKAMVTIVAALAELESANKSERISAWQEYRRLNGQPPTGPTPYGYRRERNRLVVVPAEAAAIQEAATAVLAGKSLRSLVVEWSAKGKRTFTQRGVKRILTCATVAGLREIDGVLVAYDSWEAILDRATWEQLRTLLRDPGRQTNPAQGRKWLLSGLLECGRDDCGTPMQIKTNYQHGPRYMCKKCGHSINAAHTEALVGRVVLDSLSPQAWRRLRSQGTRSVDVAALEAELVALARMRNDDPDMSFAEWKELRDGIKQRIADAAAQPVALPDVGDPRKEWPDLGVEAKRLLVSAVVPRMVVTPGKRGASTFDPNRVAMKPAA